MSTTRLGKTTDRETAAGGDGQLGDEAECAARFSVPSRRISRAEKGRRRCNCRGATRSHTLWGPFGRDLKQLVQSLGRDIELQRLGNVKAASESGSPGPSSGQTADQDSGQAANKDSGQAANKDSDQTVDKDKGRRDETRPGTYHGFPQVSTRPARESGRGTGRESERQAEEPSGGPTVGESGAGKEPPPSSGGPKGDDGLLETSRVVSGRSGYDLEGEARGWWWNMGRCWRKCFCGCRRR
ncbi:hypothetical protein XA68_10748 [Ophiocordyceps unilateralis]|uniref:Uncharacterized protein n=1 Tax=Ophiocordyceps unilateralis TaxID=268505 RepID=A0A2A9PHS7_OPHUN|nr:hypothetical protein XA68_10748 [Ophiocordyceps unilateralis]